MEFIFELKSEKSTGILKDLEENKTNGQKVMEIVENLENLLKSETEEIIQNEYRFILASISLLIQDFSTAEDHIKTLNSSKFQPSSCKLLEGILLEFQNKHKQAKTIYETILQQQQKPTVLTLVILCKLALLQDIKEFTKKYFKKAKLVIKNCQFDLFSFGFSGYFQVCEYGYILQFLGKEKEALKIFEDNAQRFKEFYLFHYYHALVLSEQMEDQAAMDALKKSFDLQKSKKIEYFMVNTYKNIGNVLFNQEKFEKAQKYYEQCLVKDLQNVEAMLNLGCCYYNLEQLEDAKTHYKKCMEISPNYAEPYLSLAETLEKEDDIEGAIEIYKQCITRAPDCLDAYLQLGELYVEVMFQLKEGIDIYMKALDVEGENRNSDIYLRIGSAYQELDEMKSALEYFDKALQVDGKDGKALVLKGTCLEMQGKLDEALKCYQLCVEYDEENVEGWQALGNIQESCFENVGEAVKAYKRCVELDPEQHDLQMALGELLMQQGKMKESVKYFANCVKMDDGNMDMIQDENMIVIVKELLEEEKEEEVKKNRLKYSYFGLKASMPEKYFNDSEFVQNIFKFLY